MKKTAEQIQEWLDNTDNALFDFSELKWVHGFLYGQGCGDIGFRGWHDSESDITRHDFIKWYNEEE